MKKIFYIICVFCLFLIVSCSTEASKLTVNYVAGEGGYIEGKATQVFEGGTATFEMVTATASYGYKFIGWSDGNINASRTDTLSKSAIFTANFEKLPVITVNYIASEGGKISGESIQALPFDGQAVEFSQITAIADTGYKFAGWSDGYTEATRKDSLTEDDTFTAIFEALPSVTVKYATTDGGIIVGEHTQTKIMNGESVKFSQVVASAKSGYRFVGWDDGHKSPFRSDTLSENATFTALFEIDPTVKITYTATDGGYIDGEAIQVFDKPSTGSQVTAIASEGYRFLKWDDGLTSETRYDSCEASASYVAIFIKVHKVTFTPNYLGNTITGEASQLIDHESQSTVVTAEAGVGYKFVGWSNGESSKSITVTATEDLNIEAIFERTYLSLPVITINTINNEAITSKDVYLDCFVNVENTKDEYLLSFESARIKGRGNSTWEYDKKPYRLKFDSGIDLFGNGKAKDWNLISNHSDLSLMRNYLALSIASTFSGLNSTAATQFVELYLNDEYVGVYLVCEHIEVQENRVNITESDGSADSFLIELDGRKDGTYFEFNGKNYVIKSPDTDSELYTDECAEQIKSYLSDCFSAIWARDWETVCSLMDVESFAQDYIVFELFKSPDVGWSSFYLHKDAGGKLKCGPAWDFDRSLGIVGHTTGAKPYNTLWSREQNPWFNALFYFEEFKALVSQILAEHITAIEETMVSCYTYAYENRDSFDRNFVRWEILGTFVWPNDDELTELETWDEQVEYTRDYLDNSIDYLISVYL